MRFLLAAALLAACAASNESTISALEADAARHSRPDLEGVPEGPAAAAGALRGSVLPFAEGARRPVVGARVNGVPLRALLDTGASGVVLSGSAARRVSAYLPAGEDKEALSPRRTLRLRPVVLERLEIGEDRFGPVAAGICRHETLAALRDVDAIVGTSVLSHYRATFDYRRRDVRLVPHGGTAYDRPLFVRAAINGAGVLLLFDTGADTLYLEPWARDRLGEVHSLLVAGREFRDPSVRVVKTFPEERDSPAGLLGPGALPARVWTLDYGTRELSIGD